MATPPVALTSLCPQLEVSGEQIVRSPFIDIMHHSTNYPEMLGTYRQDFDASSEYPVYTKEEHSLFYLDVSSKFVDRS